MPFMTGNLYELFFLVRDMDVFQHWIVFLIQGHQSQVFDFTGRGDRRFLDGRAQAHRGKGVVKNHRPDR